MQINRLFEIIYILLDKKLVTAKELSARFEVSPRTIYRDVETLSAAGIPIYMNKGRGGGISLLPDFILNKTVLTEDEKQNILSSLHAANLVPLSETNTALKKLGSLFGDVNTHWLEVNFSSWSVNAHETTSFNTLKWAIIRKELVTFLYSNGNGQTELREAEPLKLCFKGQSWYLYSYCRKRNDFRFFKLRRLRELCVSDQHFDRHAPEQVLTDEYMIEEEYVNLKLKLSPETAFRVYDEFETFEILSDGSFIAEIMLPKGDWIFSYISSFGEQCEVLEPKEARDFIAEKLQKTLNNYYI